MAMSHGLVAIRAVTVMAAFFPPLGRHLRTAKHLDIANPLRDSINQTVNQNAHCSLLPFKIEPFTRLTAPRALRWPAHRPRRFPTTRHPYPSFWLAHPSRTGIGPRPCSHPELPSLIQPCALAWRSPSASSIRSTLRLSLSSL